MRNVAGLGKALCILRLGREMGEPQRNVFCAWYPLCLNVHIKHHKRRFDCSRCARYRPIHLEAEEVIEDALNCAHFLHELFFGDYSEEWEMEKVDQDYVKVPLELIRSFQNVLFLFAGNAQAMLNIGKKISQLGDDLKSRISAGEDNELIE